MFLLVQNHYRTLLLTVFLLSLGTPSVFAQITGPEQDCNNAIPVCQEVYVQNAFYVEGGQILDFDRANSCLANGENNSVWYVFTVVTPGTLEFLIIPHSPQDYDFALFNITNASCADILTNPLLEVRCNYSALSLDSTGLLAGHTQTSQSSSGDPFLAPLPVTAGETFVLVVDKFNSDPVGYTLDFTPGTAGIIDTQPPVVTDVDSLECDNATTFNITFSEPIRCSSLASNGSDFEILGAPVTVVSVTSPDCAGGSFTQSATITLSGPITTGGTYGLVIKQGTDGNTVEDNCGNNAVRDTLPLIAPDIVNAGFTFLKSTSCAADTVRFTSTSTGNVTSLLWDFDFNNATSTLTNPTFIYTGIDTYSVTLIVSSAACSDTAVNSVIANHSYEAAFAYDPAEPCAGQPITFTDTSQTFATDYLWQVFVRGDNTPIQLSIVQNPVFTINGTGWYTVSFTINDNNLGCADTTTLDVLVHGIPSANFDADDPVCANTPVNFTDRSIGSPASWLWTFPGGSTSTDENPVYTFAAPGTFPVQLAVVDSFCGTADITQNVDVLPIPFFNLGSDTVLCRSEEIALAAYPGADSYLWSTGETSAAIIYALDTSRRTVWATATLNGCPFSDSLEVIEQTLDCSYAQVPTAFSPNADGNNDLLRVLTKRVSTYELIIFNRWGQEVYRGNNNDLGWDGSFKDEPQDLGVFGFVLNWRNLSGQLFVETGSITLVR